MAAVIAQMVSHSESWSGMLPRPDMFAQYAPDVRDRMMGWNDSFTVDESRRQDRLVEAEIEEAKKGPRRAMAIVLTAMSLAAVAGFWAGNTVLAGMFMGTPILLFATNLITHPRSMSSRADDPDA